MASVPDEDRGWTAGPVGEAPRPASGVRRSFRDAVKSWGMLTAGEQKAVIVVLALALMGIGARVWHSSRRIAPGTTCGRPAETCAGSVTNPASAVPALPASGKGGERR